MVKVPPVPQTVAALTGSAAAPRIATIVVVSRPVTLAAIALDLELLTLRFKGIDLVFRTSNRGFGLVIRGRVALRVMPARESVLVVCHTPSLAHSAQTSE